MTLRTVGVRLQAEVSGYIAGMKASAVATKDFVGELNKAAKAGNLDAVASMAGRAGLALSGGFLLAAGAAARFDKQMSAVSAVADAGAGDMDRLRDAALAAGKATSFSATEAAKAEEELAKAGISTADILGGALAGSLNLAAAGTLDLTEAAETAARTMNIFKLGGKDVGHIADVLAAGANKSAADVHQLGEALRMGGLAAGNAGLSLEDTIGTLSLFHDNALLSSDAGTSLKTMLAAPSGKAADLMKELGIASYDAQGNFVGIEKFAGQLQDRLGTLAPAQRDAALATIFGADAMRAATVLMGAGERGVRDYIKAVNDQGAAQRTAGEKTDNLIGDLERLKGSLETLAIESGTGANSGLRTLAQAAENLVGSISGFPPVLQNTALIIAGVGGAALLTSAGMIKLRGATSGALEALANVGPRGERAAAGLDKAGKMAARAGIAFAALQVGGALVSSFVDDLNPQIDAAAGSLKEWTRQAILSGEAARIFGDDTEELSRSLSATAVNGFSQFTDGVTDFLFGIGGVASPLDDAKQRVAAFDATLAKMVADGNAQRAGELVAEMAKRANVSVDAVLKVLPTYAGAVEVASKKTADNARATDAARNRLDLLGGTLADAITRLGSFAAAWDTANKKQTDFAHAEIDAEAAIDDLTAAFKDNGRTLDVHTGKGRDNTEAILHTIEAAQGAAQAKYDESQSVTDAARTYDSYIAALRTTMLQAGYTKGEVDALLKRYAAMPPMVQTQVNAPGLDDAIRKVQQYKVEIAGIPGVRDTRFRVAGTNIRFERWGGAYVHAQEGYLRESAIYSPKSPARYAFAEPATGGELFLPRYGDQERGRQLLGVGASWYGMSMVPWQAPQHTGAASSRPEQQMPTPIVHVYVGGQRIQEMVDVRVEYAMDSTARQVMSGVRT